MTTFKLLDHLMVELTDNNCFVGELVFQNLAGTKFELDNVRNTNTNQTFQSVQVFHRKDIRSMRVLPREKRTAKTTPDVANHADDKSESSDELSTSTGDSTSSTGLSSDELQRIQTACSAPIYYPHADRAFHATIAALQLQPTVALSVAYTYAASRSAVGLLTLVSAHDGRLHMFDIISMGGGRLPAALRHLLSAERPRKIMHDCSLAAYVLDTVHGCRLGGVFDTRMAHAGIGGDRRVVELADTVSLYLGVPRQSVQPANAMDWTVRPLTGEQRRTAGQQVAYLPALYAHLLYERMLAGFLASCERFAHTYTERGFDDIDMACHVSTCGDGLEVPSAERLAAAMPADGVQAENVPQLELRVEGRQ